MQWKLKILPKSESSWDFNKFYLVIYGCIKLLIVNTALFPQGAFKMSHVPIEVCVRSMGVKMCQLSFPESFSILKTFYSVLPEY